MSSIDLHNEEIGIKIVYYGPGLGGKTSSLQYMHKVLKPENRGRMISLATGIDRTLYFDFLPIQLPKIRNFSIRMSVYTVPGQVHYDATRRLVLQGADGIIFVADSQPSRRDANSESLENLYENLKSHGMDAENIPIVLQFNKRDIDGVMSIEEMNRDLNPKGLPAFGTNAVKGDDVFTALKQITKLVLADLKKKGIYSDKEENLNTEKKNVRDSVTTMTSLSDGLDFKNIGDEKDLSFKQTANDKNSSSFEFATVSDDIEYSDKETSTTLAAAIVRHTKTVSEVPAPFETINAHMSELWEPGLVKDQIFDVEDLIEQGDFTQVAITCDKLLSLHLKDRGDTHETVDEALLVLGVSGVHYVRFKDIITRANSGDVLRKDALFCLFFLTDIELRMQAAGIV